MEEANVDDLLKSTDTQITAFLNIGTGIDQTIQELVTIITKIIGFGGEILYDPSRPDGTYRKLLDVSKLHKLSFKTGLTLEEGIRNVYQWYLEEQ
jgi:GDP-L-fucose synthase